jgi:sulfide:quinone oxidoreductase
MRVVVAGAGVAALEAALALRELAEDRVTVELVAPDEDFTYRPLAVAEPFRVGEARRFPLRALVEEAGATLRKGAVQSIEPERHVAVINDGEELRYDALLLALGARPREAIPGALTFRGPEDGQALADLLADAAEGRIRTIAFALPSGTSWPLPLYELVLLTDAHLANEGVGGGSLQVITPEDRPLALFGPVASDAVRELLEIRGIGLSTRTTPVAVEEGSLRVVPDGQIEADRVVALPQLEGPRLAGTPFDGRGFVPIDPHGRVLELDDVWAAGDLTAFAVKQGGLAAQQADAAAESIAAQAGAAIEPGPFRPVLRGLLLTGLVPRYLRGGPGVASTVDTEPLWWPPAKIVGRHLAPFLAAHMGLSAEPPSVVQEGAVEVEVELDPELSHTPVG